MTYAIKILDNKDNIVGELMNASAEQVRTFIDKGMKVIDIHTNSELSLNNLTIDDTVGVSDGLILK